MPLETWQYELREAAAERLAAAREARERFGEPTIVSPPTNASGLSAREPTTTTTGRRILDWRPDPDESTAADFRGERPQQALVEGVGWCRYSWRLMAVMIGGQWELC